MKIYIRILALLMIFAVIFTFTGCSGEVSKLFNNSTGTPTEGFILHMIDVGQGDSVLLECDNQYMLIDAGESDKGDVVVSYLKNHNISSIDYAVVTHPHSDHFGGMKTVLENIEAKNVILTEASNTTRSWEKLIDYIDKNNYNVIFPKTNDKYSIGSATITAYIPKVNDELNNCSIVMRAEYNGFSSILTGDAEKSEEKLILESGFDVSANVLKVGHHGSKTSTSEDFLEVVNPTIALISCGENNDYGHPNKETITKFQNKEIEIYRTNELGSIDVTFTDKITVSAEEGSVNSISTDKNTSKIENKDNNSKTEVSECTYIGNKNSKYFHKDSCSSAKKMSEKNKVYFLDRDEAINNGYSPCKSCNP